MAETRKAIPIDLLHNRGQKLKVTGPNTFSMNVPTTTRVIWMAESDWDKLSKDEQTSVCNFFYDLFENK